MSKPIEERTHRADVGASERDAWWQERESKDPDLFKKAWAQAREVDQYMPLIPPENVPLEAQRVIIRLSQRVAQLEAEWC